MNIIKKIVQQLGFDIVRYSPPSISSNNTSANQNGRLYQAPVISSLLATKALETVGRRPDIPVFTYYERPDKSSSSMEEAENLWWNEHGKLIEKVWVLSETINRQYRRNYVSEAVSFFKQGSKKSKILDLGCGSGWFGRMIADESLEYHGMDFSSTQIEIANIEKQRSPNKDFLNYYCLTDFKKIEGLHEVTGVVIHAFLHHLYWDELHNLFRELISVLPAGCKFFILEPIYPERFDQPPVSPQLGKSFKELTGGYRSYLQAIKSDLISKNLYDTKTESELNKVVSESAMNGFFFSPKEVPFKINEFTNFLKNYLCVDGMFHCGVLNLETAQFIERIDSNEMQEHYSKLLFPLVESLDETLMSSNYFEANQEAYLFTAFKCTLNRNTNETN